ncbi:hypothetical protein C6P40_000052 [Pichia californica]|uniref:DUF4484 domain-containing protein n=1 Tax=Pichia californica TaxID=460514 RepID=A0A9P6WQQ9_9ASCO|nr:hypothetical protein C6P42_000804 [[Candida] californica]KAG0691435.1 hypothetical protein C6P40_000052 [[Candida] californica]
MQKLPPVCAMFLTKFDVHKGYELKWFKSLDDELYPKNDLEFKSIPSGLHSIQTDSICFMQPKGDLNTFLYGISIFRQNNHLQQIDNNGTVDRDKVKLYSLGILIDPLHLESIDEYNNWKPKTYSVAWKYKSELSQLLSNFMNLINEEQEEEFLNKFNKFFSEHCYKSKLNSPILSISNDNNININKLDIPQLTNVKSNTTSLSDEDFKSDHMIDSLIPFVNNFGPLIFKIWKISLLRKAIILYSPYNSSSIIVDGNEEIKHSNFTIGDMSKFLFCISLISSIPKELEDKLTRSINGNINNLLFNRPIYNVCVNDIFQLVKLDTNYLASTTDQIIIEKDNLYDYSIKLPLNLNDQSLNIPEILNSTTNKIEYATPKDFEKFKILYSKLNHTNDLLPIASKVSDIRSIQELIWNGLSWWATAGESYKSINEEFNIEFEYFDNLSNDNIDKLITLVGYFQTLTIKLFTVVIDLIDRYDNELSIENNSILILDAHDIQEMGLDPYSSSDCEFVINFIKIWWKRDVKIGNYFNGLCYWN